MRFMMDHYFKDEPMDDLNKTLMTFAAYNAGPGRLTQLRAETEKRGLDPNVWFGNVERIASERIGRETVTTSATSSSTTSPTGCWPSSSRNARRRRPKSCSANREAPARPANTIEGRPYYVRQVTNMKASMPE